MCNDLKENQNFVHNKYGWCYYETTSPRMALIYNLYVKKEYRRQGKARHLIELVLAELNTMGIKKFDIKVEPYEDSISVEDLIKFYESMGLRVINK